MRLTKAMSVPANHGAIHQQFVLFFGGNVTVFHDTP